MSSHRAIDPAPSTPPAVTPSEILEARAADQRRRMHNAVADLRETVREKTDVQRIAREHVWQAAGVAAIAGLVLGYGFGGIFTD